MKKLFFVLIILLYITGMKASAQESKMVEFMGVYIFPSFQKFWKEYPPKVTEEKIYYYKDFEQGAQLETETMTTFEGTACALLLTYLTDKKSLLTDGINIIQTTEGSIMLFYRDQKWYLLKLQELMTFNEKKRVRIFYLKNKEPILI